MEIVKYSLHITLDLTIWGNIWNLSYNDCTTSNFPQPTSYGTVSPANKTVLWRLQRVTVQHRVMRKKTIQLCLIPPPTRVEWFIIFLHFSKSNTFLPIRYIFRSSIPKNRQLQPYTRASYALQSFHFQKITWTLKFNIFWLFSETFHMYQRTIAKHKIWN